MTLQFIQNAGEDGTMRDGIYEYLKVAMPSNKTKEQNLRLLGNILKELKGEGAVSLKGLSWYEVKNPTKKDKKRLNPTKKSAYFPMMSSVTKKWQIFA